MRLTLTEEAVEESTYVVTLTFTDAGGVAVTPDALTWSLTTPAGTVINARAGVVATPDTSVALVLSGDDLTMQAGETGTVRRLLTVQATYSSTEGANLPLRDEYLFNLRPLVLVT